MSRSKFRLMLSLIMFSFGYCDQKMSQSQMSMKNCLDQITGLHEIYLMLSLILLSFGYFNQTISKLNESMKKQFGCKIVFIK
jgi:hypothetical protein